ncbi:MAG TPA: magnesium transporter CorA family protein [Rectinemataceae bacterium]|nr:magnesium transporter CorA family protein [Rectinemataceae bacterium]
MITIRTQGAKGFVQSDKVTTDCWVDVRNATKEDLLILEKDYKILGDHLIDIMDIDEQARVEKEDDYTMFIIRVPIYNEQFEVPHFTVPVGIILFSDLIVTVCQTDSEVIEDLLVGKVKGFSSRNKSAFLLHFFGRSAIIYLRFLKDINRKTAAIERDLMASVKNNELIQLLALEKSLVYFTTSLKSNEILLEKLQNSKLLRFKEDETELLEDVLNDNKQAIEMSNIYSDILSGMMDAFASVISNNLNVVMRRLTTISVIFMPLNLLAGMGGMSEFSTITQGVPYWISYPLFLLGLIPVACLTYLILKGTGPSEYNGRVTKKKKISTQPLPPNLMVHR